MTKPLKILAIALLLAAYLVGVSWVLNRPEPRREYLPTSNQIKRMMAERGPLYVYIEHEDGAISYQTERGVCFVKK